MKACTMGIKGYSIALDDQPCHLNMINDCDSAVDGGGTHGSSDYTQQENQRIYEADELLKKAFIKYSKTECSSPTESIFEFVANFNQKTPEYEQTLGYEKVLEVATMLQECRQL